MNHSLLILLSVVLVVGISSTAFAQEETNSPVEVTVSSDKLSYYFDETAVIQGTVSEIIYPVHSNFQPLPVQINISGPNFSHSASMYPDTSLNYETSLDLVQVLGVNVGTYDVTATYGDVITTSSFSVDFVPLEETEQIESSLIVETDKSEYILGEPILINGITSEIILFEGVQYSITDPMGQLITDGNLFTTDGKFGTSIILSSVTSLFGAYSVTVEYSDQTASAIFNLVENIIEDEEILISDSLTFNFDNSEYLINDNISISGSISNFDPLNQIYYQVVIFDFFTSDEKPVLMLGRFDENDTHEYVDVPFQLTAVPDTSGNFTLDARLIPLIFSEGNYDVKANYGGLISSQNFSIVDEKAVIDEKASDTFNVRSIIEKTNRISENLISINTVEKIIDAQPVKPRVLSGSMIVVDKDSQSDVNLRVKSESGTCIIGPDADCLVSESTRKPGQIFDVVQVDGLELNVRYSGSDVRLEKFSILPKSSDEFLPDANWDVEVIKNDEVSRIYYKITYKTFE